MLVGGIGLSQAVSDPHAVTLRWLRLGGIIAVTLLGVAVVMNAMTGVLQTQAAVFHGLLAVTAAACVIQLLCVQLAQRTAQRLAAALAFAAATGYCTLSILALLHDARAAAASSGMTILLDPRASPLLASAASSLMAALSSGLLGGFLMAMLLGHAYLTAGNEMSQAPFRRLTLVLGVLLVARALLGVTLGLVPYLRLEEIHGGSRIWNAVMLTARYAVGLVVPAVFTWMTLECINRRANQSATGILYVAGVLIILGEGISLALVGTLGGVF